MGGDATTALVSSSTFPPTSTPKRAVTVESPTNAALRFLDLDENLFPPVTPEKARALTDSIAFIETRDRLAAQAEDHQRQIIVKGDLADLTLRIAPIVTRNRDCNDTARTIDVYFLRLWSSGDRNRHSLFS